MITIVSTDGGRINYRTLGDTERIFLELALAFDGATAVEDVRTASWPDRRPALHHHECAAATAGA